MRRHEKDSTQTTSVSDNSIPLLLKSFKLKNLGGFFATFPGPLRDQAHFFDALASVAPPDPQFAQVPQIAPHVHSCTRSTRGGGANRPDFE